jgi:hypothetical protein
MPRSPRRLFRSLRLVVVLVTLTATAGCFTGERPTLTTRSELDDPAAQSVVDRLGLASSIDFSATYNITPTRTGQPTIASVTQLNGRRKVTIGDVTYLVDGDVTRTCQNEDQSCADYLDDARVSDLNVTHRFWGDAFAARLEIDARRRIGFSTAGNAVIAGYPAACVDITVPSTSELSGTVQYCALDAGVLGRYVGADVNIELTEFTLNPIDPGF